MNKEIRDRWVEALRSGQYKQTTGILRQQKRDEEGEKFCCLGVLGMLEWPDQWEGHKLKFSNDGVADEAEGDLPVCLLAEIGLSRREQAALIKMNDGVTYGTSMIHEPTPTPPGKTVDGIVYAEDMHPRSFKEIADYIEENL